MAPSVAEAMEAGNLPALDKDQADLFSPAGQGCYSQPEISLSLTKLFLRKPCQIFTDCSCGYVH